MSTVATAPAQTTTRTKPICRHCGAPLLDARMEETGFCCAGCAYVFRLVHEHGLASYYRIKDEITTPADAAVFQPRDFSWLATEQQSAEAAPTAIPELTTDLQGISCAGCVWLIERLFQQQPGARDIVVNAQLGTMRLRWVRGEFSAVELARKLQAFGYTAGPLGEARVEPESRGLVKRIGLCAAFAMNIMLFAFPAYFGMPQSFEYARLFNLIALAFGTLSFLVGGIYFIQRALRALRERALHIDLPIALGILGAYGGSLYGCFAGEERFVYFDFVGTFILLMLIGRWAQVAAVERNQRRLLSQQPKPPTVRTADCGDVAPEKLRISQTILLASGQTLPVESQLADASATFSLASINGESEPRLFHAGQLVPSGALHVGREEVQLVTRQLWRDSLLAQLLEPHERTSARHALLEKIVRGYLIGIIAIAVLSGVAWWYATGDAVRTWSVVTAVLVVSCPCAIGLAFPLADEIATVALRRRGVFVRAADLWQKLPRVRHLVFDKTGTLTLETPVLQNPEVLRALAPEARSALFALIRENPHPISQALLEQLLADATPTPLAGEVIESVGNGVSMGAWSLGRAGWHDVGSPATTGDTVFAWAGQVIARFRFSDAARIDARAELAVLRASGKSVQILSGDHPAKVASLAHQLDLPAESALGGLSPQQKADWLDHQAADAALMLGDGANDSLAFDRALCRGTPVIHRGVLERKADFYYLGRGIGGIRALFSTDEIRRRTQVAVLCFSVAYNLLAVGLAVAGQMNPLVAAILMPINSLLTLAIVTTGMRKALRS